ncbi:MAG: CoA transferase [Hyphomicrobiales bacterium]|uniref:CaiB/BaiF CoA transferase family protein n=1 Tax=Rhabdaerophilum calidifontis TaxID=2604328 RepID=UPI001FEACF22|nr:CaiB/BaiF CoA-transferase family protein [Rhabdaerophilum calidifontis]MCA1951884.1 CoA transferase [Hyphomicrobiales bacterium]MCA1998943.1 CoA transferase [Hyphomicrobiales bacterium]
MTHATMPAADAANRPLAGLKVLELARILAGPWVGQLLADLGADVVKVERRGAGDDTRAWGPPFVERRGGGDLGAAYFHACNRGKRSIEADFDNEDDLATIRELARAADVVIENFKVGGLAKYGLDAEGLRAERPALIYCSITGFGQEGPYATRAGYDFLIQGMAGAMSITGDPNGPPTKAGYATADIFTGMYASVAILAALRRRDATGEGATIDCALLDSQIAVLGNQAMNYLVSGRAPGRLGNAHPNIVPYEVFPVADGHVIIASGNDGQYRKLCAAIGAEALAENPDYATNRGRVAHRAALVPALAAHTARLGKAELLARLEAAGVPAGPINGIDEVFADPQVIHRGLRLDLVHGEAEGGHVPGLRTPILIDGRPQASARPAPMLGEHSQDVLSDPNWKKA